MVHIVTINEFYGESAEQKSEGLTYCRLFLIHSYGNPVALVNLIKIFLLWLTTDNDAVNYSV